MVLLCAILIVHPLLFYPKKDLRGERLASVKWMSMRELPRYFTVLSYLYDQSKFPKGSFSHLRRLQRPIMKI